MVRCGFVTIPSSELDVVGALDKLSDNHRLKAICSPGAWNLALAAARRGPTRPWKRGAAGLGHPTVGLSERLLGDFVRWATAPVAQLPAEWAESTVSNSRDTMAQRPIRRRWWALP